MSVISNMSTIAIVLGVSMVLLAIPTSFLPLQQQLSNAQPAPASPAGPSPNVNPAGSKEGRVWPPSTHTVNPARI